MICKTTAQDVASKITALANDCIARKNSFHIVLAGGETPRTVYTLLRDAKTDWEQWHVYFGDERCEPAHHPHRNDSMAFDAWLAHVTIPPAQVHSIPAELSQKNCVEQYTQTLVHVGNFDLVLLGLGEDGHTASLFPGHDWGEDPDSPPVLAVNHAPKAPARRITLSARRLSAADHVWFLVNSDAKKDILQRWQGGEALVQEKLSVREKLPASAIQSRHGIDIFTL